MAQTNIDSEVVSIEKSAEFIFNYLSDFNNFGKLMPHQVTNWQSTSDECSFTINGMATIGMKITAKDPFKKISIVSNGKVPFDFNLYILLNETDASHCTGQLRFESDMNPMLKMMVEKPLGNFFNMLAHKMKDIN